MISPSYIMLMVSPFLISVENRLTWFSNCLLVMGGCIWWGVVGSPLPFLVLAKDGDSPVYGFSFPFHFLNQSLYLLFFLV